MTFNKSILLFKSSLYKSPLTSLISMTTPLWSFLFVSSLLLLFLRLVSRSDVLHIRGSRLPILVIQLPIRWMRPSLAGGDPSFSSSTPSLLALLYVPCSSVFLVSWIYWSSPSYKLLRVSPGSFKCRYLHLLHEYCGLLHLLGLMVLGFVVSAGFQVFDNGG